MFCIHIYDQTGTGRNPLKSGHRCNEGGVILPEELAQVAIPLNRVIVATVKYMEAGEEVFMVVAIPLNRVIVATLKRCLNFGNLFFGKP